MAGLNSLFVFDRLLKGTPKNDTILGGLGDDLLEGKGGADDLRGGGGFDFTSYATANGGYSRA